MAHWPDFAHALRDIVRGLENAAFEILPLVERVFAGLLGAPLIHAINLKQYRDAADSTRACYQALVDSPFRLDDWKAGGMLPGDYTVEITTCASHTIVSDLGLGTIGPGTTTVVRPLFAFWWKMDFSTQPGTVIWQAA